MPFTEFTCRSGGSNLNAGTFSGSGEEGVNPLLVFNSGRFIAIGRTYIVPAASGDPRTLGIQTGCFVSMYSTVAPSETGLYFGRVISMTASSVLIHHLHCAGLQASVPTGATATSMRVGGAWLGPTGNNYFPFNLTSGSQLRNVDNNPMRINFKNDRVYNMFVGIVANFIGPVTYQGYANTFGDKGRATIQGPTTSGNFHMVAMGGAQQYMADFNIFNNGNAGTATYGLLGPMVAERILVSGIRGNGIGSTTNPMTCIECVAVDCNTTNTAAQGGFNFAVNGVTCIRCVAVRNSRHGFYTTRQMSLINCISYLNTECGVSVLAGAAANYYFKNCDFYLNRLHGAQSLTTANATHLHFENCNFVDNSGAAVNFSGVTQGHMVQMYNCMVGSGIYANLHGTTGPQTGYFVATINNLNSYGLDISPWVYATGGNFTPTSALARDSGYCIFPTGLTHLFVNTSCFEHIGATAMRSNIMMRRGEI